MNKETETKILQLLKNSDVANQHLAFALMKSHGVPDIYALEWLNLHFEPIWRFICESMQVTAPRTELHDMDFGWRSDYFTIYDYCFARWHPTLPVIRNLAIEHESLLKLDWTGFETLTHLETITFKNCGLTYLPKQVFQLKQLRYLDLVDNGFKEIPPDIQCFTKLEYLSLEYNPISEVPTFLIKLPNLKKINLSKTNLTQLPEFLTNSHLQIVF